MQKLSKLRALSWQAWRYLAIALLLLPALRLALRFLGFRRVYVMLLRTSAIDRPSSLTDTDIANMVRMVNIAASRGLVRANCLPRSMAVWWLLRRRDIESELCIGVNRLSGEFSAHAWVERDGVVINDSMDVRQRFAAFDPELDRNGLHWA